MFYEMYISFAGFDCHWMYFSKYYLEVADTASLLESRLRWYYNPIETDDPNDTNDTQDTHLPEGMTDIGLREMRNEYLWFNGDIALSMQTKRKWQ